MVSSMRQQVDILVKEERWQTYRPGAMECEEEDPQSYHSGVLVFFIHSGQEGQITSFFYNPGVGGESSNKDKNLRDWLLTSC